MKPNTTPKSLRVSAHCLRVYATPTPDDLEYISPILTEHRRDILHAIADELCEVAEEKEAAEKPWYKRFPFRWRAE